MSLSSWVSAKSSLGWVASLTLSQTQNLRPTTLLVGGSRAWRGLRPPHKTNCHQRNKTSQEQREGPSRSITLRLKCTARAIPLRKSCHLVVISYSSSESVLSISHFIFRNVRFLQRWNEQRSSIVNPGFRLSYRLHTIISQQE